MKRRKRLLQDVYMNTYGSLYDDLKIRDRWAIAFNIIFMIRRALIACLLVILGEIPVL